MVECVASQILGLFFEQIVLLRSQDRPGSGDSNPAYEVGGRELKVFHSIAAYQGSRPPQARFAMNRQNATFGFTQRQELINNFLNK